MKFSVCLNAFVGCLAGIVLAKEGGALGKMMPVFNIFAGGPLGSGRQWCSWIHRSAQMIPPSPSINPLHSKASCLPGLEGLHAQHYPRRLDSCPEYQKCDIFCPSYLHTCRDDLSI